jgi:hypothetical protein
MIIGLSGKMGTGKDYIAENHIMPYIEKELKEKCLILSFADMLKINLMVRHDIKLNESMVDYWNSVKEEKYDISHVGHHSGTGLVIFK